MNDVTLALTVCIRDLDMLNLVVKKGHLDLLTTGPFSLNWKV